jgi:glycosyltransferase involved in cell wall biosynthesis
MVATVAATIRQFLVPYANALRAQGWRVEAAAAGAQDDLVLSTAFDATHELPLSRSIRAVGSIAASWSSIGRLIASSRPDIVHVHTPIASFVTRGSIRRLARERRPSVVYTAHGFHFHRGGHPASNAAFLMAERVAGRWTDRLIVINDEDEEAARANRIVPGHRLVRMRGIGLDTTIFAPSGDTADARSARAGIGVPPGAPMFVSIGELNRNKRQEDAIAALEAMTDRSAHLVLVGEGPRHAELERFAADLGVAHRVHLTGQVTDVRPILGGATALVSTSAREGLSRSVMESLAMGVPVLASDARGNRELASGAGIVVAVGDVAAIAAGMDRFVAEPALRTRLGGQGRERMVAEYDIGILVGRHEALYAALLDERRSRTRR